MSVIGAERRTALGRRDRLAADRADLNEPDGLLDGR